MPHRRDAWVMLKGRTQTSARDALVELVEVQRRGRTGSDGGAGDRYAWVVFPETPHGAYTVRVTYPSGVRQRGRLRVGPSAHLVTLEEPAMDGR